jgi:glucose/arabinose dehydrogenase
VGVRDRAALVVSAALICLGAAAGCGGSDEEPTTTTPPSPPATADRAPDPSGGGQPAVGDGEGGVALEELGSFDEPVYLTQPEGDDHLYVVERCGRIQRLAEDGSGADLFLDLTGEVNCDGTEQGLLSVAFAPDYADSGLLYVYFTDAAGDQRIVEYTRAPGDAARAEPAGAREVLAMDDFASNHNGGLLLFGPDGDLWVGTGDGGGSGDPERNAQDPESPLGKLLRLDPGSGGEPEVAALGLRNPWRFSFDRASGDLWIGDVGQNELEEIDAVSAAELRGGEPLNFGWSAFEGSQRFNADQEAPGHVPPVLEYPLGEGACAVTGGYVVRDETLRSLYGRYLYADFCIGELRSFTARPGREASDDRALGIDVPMLSSFGEDDRGRIYVTSADGPVYRLAPD